MFSPHYALSLILCTAAACGWASPTTSGSSGAVSQRHTVGEKPGAQVKVDAVLQSDGVAVTVLFTAEATDVSVEARGVHGLRLVDEGTTVVFDHVAAGDSRALQVTYLEPHPNGTLVVSVRGTFGAVTQSRTASFRVGEALGRQPSHAGPTPSVHVLPAQRL